jgi:hypothetical protein
MRILATVAIGVGVLAPTIVQGQTFADPAVKELSLRVFLQTPHRNMPNLQLSQKETDDVIGFILSRKAQAGRN